MSYYQPYHPVPPQPTNGLGVAGFVCGLIGVLVALWAPGLGLILGVLGIVFGAVGCGARRVVHTGLATAGLILGIIGVLVVLAIAPNVW
jgi:hypothetical protein